MELTIKPAQLAVYPAARRLDCLLAILLLAPLPALEHGRLEVNAAQIILVSRLERPGNGDPGNAPRARIRTHCFRPDAGRVAGEVGLIDGTLSLLFVDQAIALCVDVGFAASSR